MNTNRRVLIGRVAMLGALCLMAPRASWAAWPHEPNNGNVALCTATEPQFTPASISDGSGGAIVAWLDSRNFEDNIYVQRVDSSGTPLWQADGVPLCLLGGVRENPVIVSDGAGGAIVAWRDTRGGTGTDVYAQRVSATGVPLWAPLNGVAVCSATANQSVDAIVSDGSGGAIMFWDDLRSGRDCYAQRINASGVPQWAANGVSLGGDPFFISATSDGAGGAIASWVDLRRYFSGPSFIDVYVRRIAAAGTPQWAADGVRVGIIPANMSALDIVLAIPTAITGDGAGGALVAWTTTSSVTVGNILAQRINSLGNLLWASAGVVVCGAAGNQVFPRIETDGAGGAIVAWDDQRAGEDIYARRVTAAGAPQWTVDGVPLCTAGGAQYSPVMVTDGAQGAIVSWLDNRSGGYDVYAQRVTGAGVVRWATNGAALCTALNDQISPAIVSDGAGGAIVAWEDPRNATSFSDIYAQRIEHFGQLGNPEPSIVRVRDVPNDQGSRVSISWTASYMDVAPGNPIDAYWVWRQAPSASVAQAVAEGARVIEEGAGGIEPERGALRQTTLNGQVYFWEFVGSQVAHGFAGYSFTASTLADSVGGSNPKTVFMVEAEQTSAGLYWGSPPDSGYSVDNVAPSPPNGFSAQYFPGSAPARATASGLVEDAGKEGAQRANALSAAYTWLHWGPSGDPDFLEFRLYRGNTTDFVPGPANLVVSKPDTGYVDVGAPPSYYKLVTVDVHGNTSVSSTATPANVTGVGGLGRPGELSLSAVVPNPAWGAARLRYMLPRAMEVRIDIYDAAGRWVATPEAGLRPAGEHEVRWEGRGAEGRRVQPGLYFVRLSAGGEDRNRRMVMLQK